MVGAFVVARSRLGAREKAHRPHFTKRDLLRSVYQLESSPRLMAGCFRFITLIQWFDLPARRFMPAPGSEGDILSAQTIIR
jgi:hypothetical protein